MNLFDWLLIAHLIGDFLIQSDNVAKNKLQRWPWLLKHIGLYMTAITPAVVIYALTHSLSPWLTITALLFLGGTHIILDQREITTRWMHFVGMSPDRFWLSIVVDQIFHLLSLAIVAQVLTIASG